MSAPNLFLRGRHSIAKFFLDSSQVQIDVKSWTIKREGTKIDDAVCGEDRNRPDFETTGYSVTLRLHVKDATVLDAKLKDQANDDAGTTPLTKGFGLLLMPRNGTKVGYSLTEVSLDDWEVSAGARTDGIEETVPLRARYMNPIPIP